MKQIKHLFGALVLVASAAALPAQAVPILSGNSNSSTFSNLGCTATCLLTTLSPSTLTIGTEESIHGGTDSVLSIVNTSFSASGSVTGLQLAELSLLVGQKPGVGQSGVTFDYNLVLTFTTPSGSQSQTFHLTATGDGGPGNNADVVISGLSPISLTDPMILVGVTLSNFRFDTVLSDTDSIFANGSWDGSHQGFTHSLYLVADVAANRVTPSVPEPLTLGIFGMGLVGVGALRRRRKAASV
jgi:hypothetical protein